MIDKDQQILDLTGTVEGLTEAVQRLTRERDAARNALPSLLAEIRSSRSPPAPRETTVDRRDDPKPCDACLGDSPDPGVAMRERAAIGEPPKGLCCEWSRRQIARWRDLRL
jgi:hypothetical protein